MKQAKNKGKIIPQVIPFCEKGTQNPNRPVNTLSQNSLCLFPKTPVSRSIGGSSTDAIG